MPPKFGTSGLRGLACDLTGALVERYIAAFSVSCDVGEAVFVGHDLRASSPAISQIVVQSLHALGHAVYDCGAVSTPALALAAQSKDAGAVMLTGSHIPADRNGLKFYAKAGEIGKIDEAAIVAALARPPIQLAAGKISRPNDVMERYNARYELAYEGALSGLHIGVFEHSAVGRDDLHGLLQALGATTVSLGRSTTFVPIDTEAIAPEFQAQFRSWAQEHSLDAIISTDADGDRPLLTDAQGRMIPGDILGQITARSLGAEHVVTPVSSNSGVGLSGNFKAVTRTKIGSPYVLAGMAQDAGRTVGYEANGGFILGFQAGPLAPLMTRDAMLPICAVLALARTNGVAAVVADEPKRVTASDRLENVTPDRAAAVLGMLAGDAAGRADFLQGIDACASTVDQTDGVRMTLADDVFLHLRQSGNAPELRIYTEADNDQKVQTLLNAARAAMRRALG